jgi:small GTP-binding protein
MSKPNNIKTVLLGSSGVGKSSLMYRYVTNGWDDNIQTTLGAAFMDKTVTYRDRPFKFQIWDTAGQEKYAPLAQMYYKDANVALLVFDLTSKETFASLKTWKAELHDKGPKNLVIAVVGNKCDDVDNIQITQEEAEALATQMGAFYMKTSAKENMNVQELFDRVCDHLIEKHDIMAPNQIKNNTKLTNNGGGNTSTDKKKCC